MKNCIFCKIVEKTLPAKIVFENKDFLCFHDINPKARFHVLIVPKKHISSLENLKKEDKELMSQVFFVIQKIAKKLRLNKKGYKIAINVGREAGQLVDHLHFHFLAGWKTKHQLENQKFP
jgi:histidine triad (HIT) family protein